MGITLTVHTASVQHYITRMQTQVIKTHESCIIIIIVHYPTCIHCYFVIFTVHSKQVVATRMQSAPPQTFYASMSTSSTVSVGTLEDGPTGQLNIFQAPSPFRCKLPRCNNSCFKEVTGRVHDFCSKAHAIAYMELQKQPPSFMPPPLEGLSAYNILTT